MINNLFHHQKSKYKHYYPGVSARILKIINFIKTLSKKYFNFKKEIKILDIGSSNNFLENYIKEEKIKYIGIDITGNPTIISDVERGLPFKKNSFHIVIASEIIEHIIDTDLFLEECKRVLKRNGILILTTPNLGSWINRVKLLFGKQPQYCESTLREFDAGHVRCYTASALIKQLKEHKFRILNFEGDLISFKILPLKFKMFLGKLFPTFSHCLIVVCKK